MLTAAAPSDFAVSDTSGRSLFRARARSRGPSRVLLVTAVACAPALALQPAIRRGGCPLYEAVRRRAPLDVVRALATAEPRALTMETNESTPLDLALGMQPVPLDLVAALIEMSPPSARTLSVLVRSSAPTADIVAFLAAHPGAASAVRCKDGCHCAAPGGKDWAAARYS